MEDTTRVSIEYKQLIEAYIRIIRWWSNLHPEVQADILRCGYLEGCLRFENWAITAITKEHDAVANMNMTDKDIADKIMMFYNFNLNK